MNILITGGAGFIGAHLVTHHLNKGDSVFAVDDLSSGVLKNISTSLKNDNFKFFQADIANWPESDSVIAQVDRIYHLAAIVGMKKVLADPVRVMSVNMSGTEKLFESVARSNTRATVLLASTSEVYGFNPNSLFSEDENIIFPSGNRLRWCYAVTKLADEFLSYSYVNKFDMNTINARLFNTIGPNQTGRYGWVVPTFIQQAIKNEALTVYGDGSQTRSFCDVRDTVEALDLLASHSSVKGDVVNVGNPQEISILDLAKVIIERVGSQSKIQFIPFDDAYGLKFEEIYHRKPNIEKLRQITKFQPQWTLFETLDQLIQLFRASH